MSQPPSLWTTLNYADIALHRASQLISLTAVNLVSPQADDSHTNMEWLSEGKLRGHSFNIGELQLRATVSVGPYIFTLENEEAHVVKYIALHEKTFPQILEEWVKCLRELGIEKDLITQLHYDLPDSDAYADTHPLQSPGLRALESWENIRTLANRVLTKLNQTSGWPSDIRIWPHHFDTGVYYDIVPGKKVIGGGLAMADTLVPMPYFYLYGWQKGLDINYAGAPQLSKGQWLTKKGGWNGAMLPIDQLEKLTDAQTVNSFFEQALFFFKDQLQI